MAAFQPIELPAPQGLNGMAEYFQGLRQDQHKRQQDAWNQMIQQGVSDRAQQELELRRQEQAARLAEHAQAQAQAQQDRMASVHKELQGLHDSGLAHEAQQLAGIYGLTQTADQQVSGPRVGELYNKGAFRDFAHSVTETPGQTDLAGGGQPMAPGQLGADFPEANRPIPPDPEHPPGTLPPAFVDQMENGRAGVMFGEDTVNVPGMGGAVPMRSGQHIPVEGPMQAAPPPEGDPPIPGTPSRESPGADPIAAAAAQYTAAAPSFHYAGAGGGFDVFPGEREAAARAQNQRRADLLREQFMKDPALAPYASEAAARVAFGEDPRDVTKETQALRLASAKDAQHQADEAKYKPTVDQQDRWHRMAAAAAMARATTTEANPVIKEMGDAVKPVVIKGGLRDQIQHMGSTLEQLKAQPDNPVAWTNALDAAIRTNTGRAAIKAQYDLYREHARGAVGSFDSWLESKKTGLPGEEERKNFSAAFKGSYNELLQEEKKYADTFNLYQSDPRVLSNPKVKNAFEGQRRNTFAPTDNPLRQKTTHPAQAPTGETRTLPDGRKVRKVGPNRWEAVQ